MTKNIFLTWFVQILYAFDALILVVLPLLLLLKPATYFDHGPVRCLSRLYLGTECWGCGLTRATMHLLHGDFMEAFYFNALVFVTTPLLILAWAYLLLCSIKLIRPKYLQGLN